MSFEMTGAFALPASVSAFDFPHSPDYNSKPLVATPLSRKNPLHQSLSCFNLRQIYSDPRSFSAGCRMK